MEGALEAPRVPTNCSTDHALTLVLAGCLEASRRAPATVDASREIQDIRRDTNCRPLCEAISLVIVPHASSFNSDTGCGAR